VSSSYSLSFYHHSFPTRRASHSFPTRRSSDLSASAAFAATRSAASRAATPASSSPDFGSFAFNIASASEPNAWPCAWSRMLPNRSEEHTSELQSLRHLVCRLLLEKKKTYDRALASLHHLTRPRIFILTTFATAHQ